MTEPILITGCARSGTSMVAGVVNMCGAFGGHMSGPTKSNRRGMFENSYIRQHIVKPYLRQAGADPLGQYPLPDVNDMVLPRDWRRRIEQVIQEQGYERGPWMYKGAKMCLMWPVWNYAFPGARWVIVRRRTGDIVNSCLRTGFMRAFALERNRENAGAMTEKDGWLWWVHQHEERFREMVSEGLQCKIIWPERMIAGNYVQLREVVQWLGLEWNDKVTEFIDPLLWHTGVKRKEKV